MKKLNLLVLGLLFAARILAQELAPIERDVLPTPVPPGGSLTCPLFNNLRTRQIDPLTGGAFDKFIIDLYSFTILGSPTPATGLKFETVNPSITLKGNIISSEHRGFVTTLELTAGVNNGVSDIFSQNKLSSYFKINLGFNLITSNNTANYNPANTSLYCHLRSNTYTKYNALVAANDTLKMLAALTGTAAMTGRGTTWAAIWADYSAGFTGTATPSPAPAVQAILIYYLERFDPTNAGRLISTPLIDAALINYARDWSAPLTRASLKDDLLRRYKKFNALKGKFVDSLYRYEIAAVNDLWTSKHISWFNISPSLGNTTFADYHADSKTIEQRKSIIPGIKLSLNTLWKPKEAFRYVYLYGGIALQKVNTLDEMTKFTYKKTNQIKVPDPLVTTSTETLTKEETGTGYEGDFREGFGYDIFADFYGVFWKKSYIPGIYAEVKYSHGNPWITRDKLALSAGAVFNVTGSDKDSKNLLSIVPYVKWSNVLKEYTDLARSGTSPLHDQFSIGISVGIPINIGK